MKPLTFKEIQKLVSSIRKQAGNPPFVLWSWKSMCLKLSDIKKDDFGILTYQRVMAINPNQTKGNAINTIWHEIGHLLFPDKPHWWIECYAQRMSCRDYRGRKKYWCGVFGPYTKIIGKYAWFLDFPYARDLFKETKKRSQKLRRPKSI